MRLQSPTGNILLLLLLCFQYLSLQRTGRQNIQQVFTLYIFLSRVLPESPSWLVLKGRFKDARKIFQTIGGINGKEFDDVFSEHKTEVVEEKAPKMKELFIHKNVRKNTLAVLIIWFALATSHCFFKLIFSMMGFICYYGHVLNTSNLGDNIFTSNFLGALVEVSNIFNKAIFLSIFLFSDPLLVCSLCY